MAVLLGWNWHSILQTLGPDATQYVHRRVSLVRSTPRT